MPHSAVNKPFIKKSQSEFSLSGSYNQMTKLLSPPIVKDQIVSTQASVTRMSVKPTIINIKNITDTSSITRYQNKNFLRSAVADMTASPTCSTANESFYEDESPVDFLNANIRLPNEIYSMFDSFFWNDTTDNTPLSTSSEYYDNDAVINSIGFTPRSV